MRTSVAAASLALVAALGLSTTARAGTIVYTSSAGYVSSGTTTTTFGTSVAGGYTASSSAYDLNGLTITSNGTLHVNDSTAYGNAYPDGNYVIGFGAAGGTNVVTIDFPAATAFSIDLGGTYAAGEVFTYLLSDGTTGIFTASEYPFSGSGLPLNFLGFDSTTPLTSITLTFSDQAGPNYGTFDNVSFGSDTPEPSSLALLGTGLFAVAAVARRKFSVRS